MKLIEIKDNYTRDLFKKTFDDVTGIPELIVHLLDIEPVDPMETISHALGCQYNQIRYVFSNAEANYYVDELFLDYAGISQEEADDFQQHNSADQEEINKRFKLFHKFFQKLKLEKIKEFHGNYDIIVTLYKFEDMKICHIDASEFDNEGYAICETSL